MHQDVQIEDFLAGRPAVQFVRLQWVDFSGILHARYVTPDRCRRLAAGHETLCLAQNNFTTPIATAPVSFPSNDHHDTWCLRPDWSSVRQCGFRLNHASVMCFIDQMESARRFDKCPRTRLVDTLKLLEHEQKVEATLGFEIEFVLLDQDGNLYEPLDRLAGCSRTAGLRTQTLDLMEDIVAALKLSSINVHQFHTEGRDQLEVALAPESALRAIDSLVMAQETIHCLCLKYNLRASMLPKCVRGLKNGLHLHLSFDSLGAERFGSFMAGLLDHMPSLCAFGMANYDSYERASDDAAGQWVGYGTDNRDLPIRKINEEHIELRMLDSTANVYLFTAVVLSVGLSSLRMNDPLHWQDCSKFPARLDASEREYFGLLPMPTSLELALSVMREDPVVVQAIGQEMLNWYLAVKDKEIEYFAKMTEEERVQRFNRYL